MTLFNQINSLLLVLFLLVMSSLFYFQFTETTAFMSKQMRSDLNNTSTSLSLMLKPHLKTGDVATAETLINVIFEGGFYQKVSLTWLVDQKQQVWKNPITIKDVPQWFINLGLFKGHSQETVITSGWLQLATLKIQSNPAIAYHELWRIMTHMVQVLVLIFIISTLVFRLRLKAILKPLNAVALHADNIAQRKFSENLALPKTAELKKVVSAVNAMSGQLKLVFTSLDEQVNHLKNEKLFDAVSQLPNRAHLTGQLNSWLHDPGIGALLLAEFDWLEEIHRQFGYQLRDQTIKIMADKLQESLPESFIARISNTEFAFLVMNADKKEISQYLQLLIRLINQEMLKAGCTPNSDFSIGISERTSNVTRVELLSQADHALQKARLENQRSKWFAADVEQEFTQEEWCTRLEKAIANNQFTFQWQPVHLMENDQVMQREIYCRLQIDGENTRAAEFMPYVERLALGHQLDRCILEAMIKNKILSLNKEPVAINLTRESIVNNKFHTWLTTFLKQINDAHLIHFEISETGATNCLADAIKLRDIITKGGAQFGIDHCGKQLGSLEYLQLLKPDYVKLDLSLSSYQDEEGQHNLHNIELCRALVNIAHGLEIKVVITGIEDDQHLQKFKVLQVEGYQGYISAPVEI
ncbi:EAL domain-containing protein [Colwellia sp. C1TZA3]|uniref:bifunctional diguanylate cyclase/phosphodiesterase n=1 Tax=Colwellia sp. C1TZA3 TaxID=2508879 RepID=UPI0011B9B704|nr:EAL domain-containing protein [Colwellia sp. C1TZA3]TWX65022.1 EAL domain-containing protein [Colwellia sp. C1TZA3]